MKALLRKLVVFVLTLEARLVLSRRKPKIVGVTGSVGKTSAKDAIAAVLSGRFRVAKSQKSFNSELGVPLTVLGLDTAWGSASGWLLNILKGFWRIFSKEVYPELLVLEMGVDHPGDMRGMVSWVPLDAAVVTHIGEVPVHVEFFSSVEALVEEKGTILEGLREGGVAVLSYDDARTRGLATKTKCRVTTFGTAPEADLVGDYYTILYTDERRPSGISFKVSLDGSVVPVSLRGVIGRQFMYPILAAFSVGRAFGMNAVEMTDGLSRLEMSPGRSRILEGLYGTTVIDDTYNSSPIAVQEALENLRQIEIVGRRVAVLGDMMELGKFSAREHEKIGNRAADVVDLLVTVGIRAKGIALAAKEVRPDLNTHSCDTSVAAGEFLREHLEAHDVVLVKGSQSVRLERAVKQILARPEEASNVLVRQSDEWEKR